MWFSGKGAQLNVTPDAVASKKNKPEPTPGERAAEELSNRIAHRVEDRLGVAALDRLAELFVGTIHAFCFRLLQQRKAKPFPAMVLRAVEENFEQPRPALGAWLEPVERLPSLQEHILGDILCPRRIS